MKQAGCESIRYSCDDKTFLKVGRKPFRFLPTRLKFIAVH
ncbi:hypothetical protein TFKS16_0937 [Tannerella forsythia KS16]|uniref:Uncharacterized protein n=1 Tax=Tannerella forsythia (strain ATCC 43037 / JCM 10827 / CCUG 21028 A / KCTC 5666 / FDC 338) TaxID=203275 RepID=G8UJT1_TANFA|nr:hypothetical protein BFO_1300 [Tannerella forsythia 92A2]BAR48704.1 hypothetical protein TF3313_1168 [Tannerella forsythia 3313]BAR51221.1 hypothetical protein TFKS16_0937 [Tannerella forsythia KS16]